MCQQRVNCPQLFVSEDIDSKACISEGKHDRCLEFYENLAFKG